MKGEELIITIEIGYREGIRDEEDWGLDEENWDV